MSTIKKLFKLIFVALFSLLFFMVFLIYREQDISNMHNLFDFQEQYENGDIYFANPLSEEEQKQVIKKAETITDNEDVTIVFTHYDGPAEKIEHFQYYVSGNNESIQKMVPSSVDIPKQFSKSLNYLTTDRKDLKEEAIPFFSFYSEANYSVYPMAELTNNPEAMTFGFTYYFNNPEKQSYFENLFSSSFKEFNGEHNILSHASYDRDEALLKNTVYISLIVLALSVTFVLFKISNALKEISILKLNGYQLKDVLLYLFKENILLLGSVAVFIPSILTFISFQTFNDRILQFLTQVLSISLLLVGFYVLVVLLSLFIIRYVRLSDLLKNKNINRLLTRFIYGTLILTSIFVLPIINHSVEKLIDLVPYYLEERNALKEAGNLYTIQEINDPKREWEFNPNDYMLGEENSRNKKHIEIYNTLEKKDAIYYVSTQVIGGSNWDDDVTYLLYEINEKYFEEQEFYIDREKINVTNKEDINVFMNRETFQKEDWTTDQFTHLDNVETSIYLFDQVDYVSYDDEDYKNHDNEQAPIFVYTNHSEAFVPNITSGSVYFDGQKIEETKEYLDKVDIGKHLTFQSSKEKQKKLFGNFLYTVREELMKFLPGALCLVILFIAFRKFVLLANDKKWRILKSNGFRIFDLTKGYLIALVLLNIVVIAIQLLFWKTILWGSMMLIGFLSLLSYILINRATSKIKIN